MNRSAKVHFDMEQIQYLVVKTGADDPSQAVEIFMEIIRSEKVDPFKIEVYLQRLMEMDKTRNANRK